MFNQLLTKNVIMQKDLFSVYCIYGIETVCTDNLTNNNSIIFIIIEYYK